VANIAAYNNIEYSISLNPDAPAVGVRLDIYKWNKPNILPRITFFSGEMHEGFTGNTLKSIEVLEEKTGDMDKLSYGISSNYCKAEVLNTGKKFYRTEFYDLLRRGRSVSPAIICGERLNAQNELVPAEFPLGKFYSDEWKLDDSSMFMSVKAYDILYSLKNLTVNFGMGVVESVGIVVEFPQEGIAGNNGVLTKPIVPYKNKTVAWVLNRLFSLIDAARKDNGLFEPIYHDIRLTPATAAIELPYVLIEEKPVWDILQDIANFCCAYIYADREGKIIIEEDDFTDYMNPNKPGAYMPNYFDSQEISEMKSINPDNSFSYGLPVTSRTVVNRVNVEYCCLEKSNDKDDDDKIEIKKEDCIFNGAILTVNVKLKKVYEKIETINIIEGALSVGFIKICEAHTDCLKAEFEEKANFEKFKIQINENLQINNYKKEKREFSNSKEESISVNGLFNYDYKAMLFATAAIGIPSDINAVTTKILKKYQNGITYIDTEWKGDTTLGLNAEFTAKSQYDDIEMTEVYECLSNEFKFSNNFRQKTKGREIWEGEVNSS